MIIYRCDRCGAESNDPDHLSLRTFRNRAMDLDHKDMCDECCTQYDSLRINLEVAQKTQMSREINDFMYDGKDLKI